MQNYTGKITTTGTSKAIRLEQALFKSHPEFAQKSSVKASVIAEGKLLISVEPINNDSHQKNDPILGSFLQFIEKDIKNNPNKIEPLNESTVDEAENLTEAVNFKDKDFE